MNWTKEQEDAIYKKGSNILVAAAAGSGKTAVLVERIIQKILNDGIDIDKLLVVTFTNAAASEMRERVLEAIYKKLDEEPDNENLQKQIILLGKSNICTIHSFCLDVIKNNFFEIDLSANFRIAAEEEIELLKQEVLEDVFEKLYESDDQEFENLVNTYTEYRGDEALKEIVLNIYKFMQSSPFPNEWLSEKVDMFGKQDDGKDFSESVWGKILLKNLKDEVIDAINGLKLVKTKLERYIELEKWSLAVGSDIENLKGLYDAIETKNFFDVLIAAYLINPLKSDYSVEDVSNEYFGKMIPEFKEKFGSLLPNVVPQRKQGDMDVMPTSTNATIGLADVLKKKYNYDYDYTNNMG